MRHAVLSARTDAGGGLSLVAVDVDADAARAYTAPGQYVELRTRSASGFFVLAGDLGAPRWELLVRDAGEAAGVLVGAPIGTALDLQGPFGEGFPTARAAGRAVLVAVVGSALGVARPLLRARIAEGLASSTHVYVGARTPGDVPLPGEVEHWAEAGADVVLCLSRSARGQDAGILRAARREAGYVQDVVARHLDEGVLPRSLVFAAGPSSMLAAMRGLPGSVLEVVTNV